MDYLWDKALKESIEASYAFLFGAWSFDGVVVVAEERWTSKEKFGEEHFLFTVFCPFPFCLLSFGWGCFVLVVNEFGAWAV